MTIFKFNVGDKVRDTITKFDGIVVARTEWLNGCVRYQIQTEKLKDGKPHDLESFDEIQLVLVKAVAPPKVAKLTGGPKPDEKSPFRHSRF